MSFPSKKRCKVCDGPLTVHQEVSGGICERPACLRGAINLARDERARALLHEVVDAPHEVALVIIPAAVLDDGNVPARRRRRFRNHLYEVVHAACTPGAIPEPYAPQLRPSSHRARLLGQACGVCQGRCCMDGRDHAFVDVDGVMRAMRTMRKEGSSERNNPGHLRPWELIELYLGSMPVRHCLGSCVFHTSSGCTLPRAVRGSVCNNYYCPGLRDLDAQLERGAKRVLVVAMDGIRVVRWAMTRQGRAPGQGLPRIGQRPGS